METYLKTLDRLEPGDNAGVLVKGELGSPIFEIVSSSRSQQRATEKRNGNRVSWFSQTCFKSWSQHLYSHWWGRLLNLQALTVLIGRRNWQATEAHGSEHDLLPNIRLHGGDDLQGWEGPNSARRKRTHELCFPSPDGHWRGRPVRAHLLSLFSHLL